MNSTKARTLGLCRRREVCRTHSSTSSPAMQQPNGIPMNTQGSIALVTGASSGIGKATAERLATAGYKVYGTSRRGAQTDQRRFQMLPLDVTSDESVNSAVNELINNGVRRYPPRIVLDHTPQLPRSTGQ